MRPPNPDQTDDETTISIHSGPTGEPRPISAYKVSFAALVGTTIEYYDYGIFGYLAVTISPLFFPSHDEVASLLSTLAVFGIAFVVRPLGGLVLGRLGDQLGRKRLLLFTVLSMGIASGLIGLLPTHQSIGVLAPVLLVVCRLVQGFSAGGEVGGAATYVAECAPPGRRGLFGTATPVGAGLGFALAAAVAGIATSALTPAQMSTWGWRVPFLIAIPLAIVCVAVRSKIEDSPEFDILVEQSDVAKAPLQEVFRSERSGVLRIAALSIAQSAGAYIGLTYMNVYLTKVLGYPPATILWIVVGVVVAAVAFQPLAGHLSDIWGRRPLLLAGLIGYIAIPYPAMQLMSHGNMLLVTIALLLLFVPYTLIQAVGYPSYAEMIGRRVRYTGVSLGFNIGALLAGGTSPYLATALIEATGDRLAPAYLVIGATTVGLLGLFRAKETAHSALRS